MQEKRITGKLIDRITVKSLPTDSIPALLRYCVKHTGNTTTLANLCKQVLLAVAQMYPVPEKETAWYNEQASAMLRGIKLDSVRDWLDEPEDSPAPWIAKSDPIRRANKSERTLPSGKTPAQQAAFEAMYPGEIDAWAPEPEVNPDQPPAKKKLSNDILKGVYYTIRGMGKKRFLTMKDAVRDLKDLIDSGYPCPFERLTQQEWVDWVGAGNDQIYQIHEDFMPLSSLTGEPDPHTEHILTNEWLAAHDITRPSEEKDEIE